MDKNKREVLDRAPVIAAGDAEGECDTCSGGYGLHTVGCPVGDLPFTEVVAEFSSKKFASPEDCRIALLTEVVRLRAAVRQAAILPDRPTADQQAAGSVEAEEAKPWSVWGVAQRHDLADITDGAGKLITTMYAKSAREVVAAHNAEIAALASVQPVATGSVDIDERHQFELWKSKRGESAIYEGDGRYQNFGVTEQFEAFWAGIDLIRAALDSRAQPVAAGELPAVLFDGYAVLSEITRHLGESHCHSADTVAATLDAVVRLLRADSRPAGGATLTEDERAIALSGVRFLKGVVLPNAADILERLVNAATLAASVAPDTVTLTREQLVDYRNQAFAEGVVEGREQSASVAQATTSDAVIPASVAQPDTSDMTNALQLLGFEYDNDIPHNTGWFVPGSNSAYPTATDAVRASVAQPVAAEFTYRIEGCTMIGYNEDGSPPFVYEGDGFVKTLKAVNLVGWTMIGPNEQGAGPVGPDDLTDLEARALVAEALGLGKPVAAAVPDDVAKDAWISVSDRLPAKGEHVIAYRPTARLTQDEEIRIVRFKAGETESWQGVVHGFDGICHPTHWMPLPAAPTTEGADHGN